MCGCCSVSEGGLECRKIPKNDRLHLVEDGLEGKTRLCSVQYLWFLLSSLKGADSTPRSVPAPLAQGRLHRRSPTLNRIDNGFTENAYVQLDNEDHHYITNLNNVAVLKVFRFRFLAVDINAIGRVQILHPPD